MADELKKKSNEVETLMKRKLPVVVGRMAKGHYQENFRKGGFQVEMLYIFSQLN